MPNQRLDQYPVLAVIPAGLTIFTESDPTVPALRAYQQLPASLLAASGLIATSGLTVATNTLLGRVTAATGPVESLTPGTSLVLTAGGINTVQDIRTTATPQFARLGLGTAADPTALLKLGALTGRLVSAAGLVSVSTVLAISTTGSTSNLDFQNAEVLYCDNATLLTITGLLAGYDGQRLVIISRGAGQVDIANQALGSSAANRINNGVTGTRSLAAGSGVAVLQYDTDTAAGGVNPRWRCILHNQGAWITPAFSAADYTGNGAMTWTVAAGQVTSCAYWLKDRTLEFILEVIGTAVGGTPNTTLQRVIPGGFTAAKQTNTSNPVLDNGSPLTGRSFVTAGAFTFGFRSTAGAVNWTASAAACAVQTQLTIEVQ